MSKENQSPHTASSSPPAQAAPRRSLAPYLFVLLIALGWWGWPQIKPHLAPLLPPISQTPFYAIYLSFQDAPAVLPMPVAGVRLSRVADTWGAPRGSDRRHEGIDIFAKRGTTIVSTTEGIVTRMGTTGLGGKVVWVLGPGGQRHYYAHLDTHADLAVGDPVTPGSALGTVGNSGNARGTPPHLHYGLYVGGGAINPYPFLQGFPKP